MDLVHDDDPEPVSGRVVPEQLLELSDVIDAPHLGEAAIVFLLSRRAAYPEDVREGIASFFEKRKPVWKNR